MGKAVLWVLREGPHDVTIIDKEGRERHPDLEKVKAHPRLRGAYVTAGRYAKGVGQYFYGGKLGNKSDLTKQGNEHTTNDEIMVALGYEKTEVELD